MAEYMRENGDEVLLTSTEEGVNKVQHDNYAFLMESSTIEYEVAVKCDLEQVGPMLDLKGYGIAMKKSKPPFIAYQSSIIL